MSEKRENGMSTANGRLRISLRLPDVTTPSATESGVAASF